jgi:predicted histidine transporter YuiF (NhaC family)
MCPILTKGINNKLFLIFLFLIAEYGALITIGFDPFHSLLPILIPLFVTILANLAFQLDLLLLLLIGLQLAHGDLLKLDIPLIIQVPRRG